MDLEMLVARSVAWAHMIERALHDQGPWTFRTAGGITPAHRIIERHRGEIVFTGITRPAVDGVVELWAGERMVTVTSAETEGSRITWKMSLKEPSRAS